MIDLKRIVKPTLLIDKTRALRNIKRMTEKAHQSKVRFRPHFKTHQSAAIGQWFSQVGVDAITVSSVEMAGYFANHGWENITIAFPVNIREVETINALAKKVVLGLLVESTESIVFLADHLTAPVDIWLKIDVGLFRTGIGWDQIAEACSLIEKMNDSATLHLKGLLTHAGHTYRAESTNSIREIYGTTVDRLQFMKAGLAHTGAKHLELSLGDTPSCSVVENFHGVDEIRPGNFVFYDAMQLNLGVCDETDIAVAVACPVVAKHPARNEIVIYGGAVHLSKDSIVDRHGHKIFGYVAMLHERGWSAMIPSARVSSISQEHGVVSVPDSMMQRLRVGDLIAVIPVHSCLVINLLRQYLTMDGEILTTMTVQD